ncbi:hypothetical protein [Nonlabens sp.]|uniref:hypothetical protein n=1 Tax=Nonlabens sp. TaxID=1888209 RepID=UPI003F69B3CE
MKTNKLITIVLLLILSSSSLLAQENFNDEYVAIETRIEAEIIKMREQAKTNEEKQKEKLKVKIEEINKQLDAKKITLEEADLQKKEAAENTAQGIIAYNKLIEAKIDYMKARKIVQENGEWSVTLNPIDNEVTIFNGNNRKYKKHHRTEFSSILAFGYNYWSGDNLTIDDFSYKNNNFFQFGIRLNTLLDKNNGLLRLNYGLDMILHSAELNGNRAVTIGGSNTQIAPIGFNVDKAQFTQLQLVAPLHIEIGGSKRKDYEDGRVRFDTYNEWKAGIGGFIGFNLRSTLNYKFEQDGRNIRQDTSNAFDTNTLVYGVDAYVGYGSLTLFGRMNLNNIFKSDSVDVQYVSFGIALQ